MSVFRLLFLLYQLVVIVVIIRVVMDNRQPVKTMAWALVIYFIPVVGIILYFFFGTSTRKARAVSRRQMDQLTKRSMLSYVEQTDLHLPEQYRPVIDLFVNQSFALPFNNNEAEVYTDGYQFFPQLLADIAHAREHIHIDIYIFEDDALGNLVADALIDRVHEGVEVRVIYDDVGCWSVKPRFFERMREEGIEVVPFLPVRFPSFTSRVNYRNHRKLIVIDGLVGYIGGMNFADRYVKGIKYTAYWRDTMMRISGRGVYGLQRAFLIDWYFVDGTLFSDKKYYPKVADDGNRPYPVVQTVTSSPTSPYPEIMQGFVRIILQAKRYVFIQTPYFMPTEPVLFALKTAAISGTDVRIMVPQQSDAHFAEWASRSYLREAVEAGVKVSLYQGGFLHAKTMVCDDNICTCGSTNVDFRSFENNFEANTFFYDTSLACHLRDIYLADERQSVTLADMAGRMRPRFIVRLLESLVRLLSPLM